MGAGGLGGAPAHDAGANADASIGDGSIFSYPCFDLTSCCLDYRAACADAGGTLEYCNSSMCTPGPPYDVPAPGQCLPLAAPAAGKFVCEELSCNVGEVCGYKQPYADGCSQHQCLTPPAACVGSLTCACLQANLMGWLSTSGPVQCSADASGNITLTYYQ
jgi:hypothetical protein